MVYVDNDPVGVRTRALLEENDYTYFSAADIFEPRQVINDEVVHSYLDFSEPIALFQLGTLHHYAGERSRRASWPNTSMPYPRAPTWRSATSAT